MTESETKTFSAALTSALRLRGMTVSKLAELTGISERFIESLLEERFESLPSSPYVHGYLMKMAEVLGIDGEQLWQDYLKDNELIRRSGEKDTLPQNRFITSKFNPRHVLIGVAILAVFLYLFFMTPLFRAGGLTFFNPSNDVTYASNPTFEISGKVEPAYKLTLNGERIYPDENGNFKKEITLREGFNTFVFSTKKFLSKENNFTKQIFYQPRTEPSTSLSPTPVD